MIVPHNDWRGTCDRGTTIEGSCLVYSTNGTQLAPPPDSTPTNPDQYGGVAGGGTYSGTKEHCIDVDWPAAYTWSARQYRRGYSGPDSWMGSLIFESRDASGLYYRRNRYYDSEKGRFTQEDPIGLEGGVNVYGFGRGDPVTYSDAFGLLADSVWIGIRPLAIPVVGVWYVHSSVRVDNEMFELLQNENGNSKVIRTTVAGNSDLEKYTWYPVSTPEGQTDAQFSDRVRRNAISLGGRINTDHPDYEALGKNCHWYTRSVITASGAQVPGRAWTERGIAPGLCRNGACTPVETRPLIQH